MSSSQAVYSQLGMEEGAIPLAGDGARVAGKQGHSCCGCCCDTRRAVIIVNAVMVAIMIIGTFGLVVGVEFLEMAAQDADDDAVKELGEELAKLPLGVMVIRNLILTVMFAVGIVGGVNYNPQMVQVAYVGYAIKLIFDLREQALADIIMDGFFSYPHWYFLKEMKENIMTPDNYPNEAQCCC